MRGALAAGRGLALKVGIIPADAGSTPLVQPNKQFREDHPRGCGEHTVFCDLAIGGEGSSPRMRGARPHHMPSRLSVEIIPADAGSTGDGSAFELLHPDHPRGCGEHWNLPDGGFRRSRSSPRMRGARETMGLFTPEYEIIPADAGSTSRNWMRRPTRRDHPRGCGEHGSLTRSVAYHERSSPRMRGAPMLKTVRRQMHEIIPADAGSTNVRTLAYRHRQDHPRGCGEHT